MVRATNPAATILVYEDGVSPTFDLALASALAAMADDGTAQTISISYGDNEFLNSPDEPFLVELAAQGQAVFASAGDLGAFGDGSSGAYALLHPSSSPFVTSVGGTSLFTLPHQAYGAEEAWNLLATGHGATGGGVSAIWPIPAWQIGTTFPITGEASTTQRNAPDVAAVGNPYTGVAVYSQENGGWLQIGGTSASAPIWAGFYSLLNASHIQLGLGALGFFNPALYADEIAFPFYDTNDILSGTNGGLLGLPGYAAGTLYDNVSGWGSMNGAQTLYPFLTNPVDKTVAPPGAPFDLQASLTGTTASFTWHAAKNATGYVVEGQIYNPNFPPPSVTPQQLAVTTGTQASIGTLQPNTLYAFRLNAVNRGGETFGPFAILKTGP